MKILLKIIICSWLVGSSTILIAETARDQAKAITMAYFEALKQGNTVQLVTLMGPEEAADNAYLIEDTSYGGWLAERFQGATIEQEKYTANGDQTTVDLTIRLPSSEQISETLIIDRVPGSKSNSFKIIRRNPS